MNALILVAAGSGSRMGGPVPKQYLDLAGKPLIVRALEKFFDFDPGILSVVVIASGHLGYWEEIARTYLNARKIRVILGGGTRFESVEKGLDCIGSGFIVGIHDAVRPLVSLQTIERSYAAASDTGSGIPVIGMEDSVRRVTGENASENLDRKELRRVQTPQVFLSEQIREAYRNHRKKAMRFTDDATVYESQFGHVTLVEGNRENIKVTNPEDLRIAASMCT